ncbi:ferredoxin reductase-like protein [Hesseltinella vesiculosa]|uniref:NADH-cytochrome b5 reductase n=1 Tax=Hesseltinella vesiculosa TaxID=101127 RepID=A0A1X2GIH7_9FUNG|nr:ferredoxin reductase-like protein [Hesseltinella vesiculosa]
MAIRAPASLRTIYRILCDPLILGTSATIASVTLALWYYSARRSRSSRILDQHLAKSFPLVEKIKVNHNTSLYRFALPRSTDTLDLPIGQHISIVAVINGKEEKRSYTPTTGNDTFGHFDLVIKTYPTGLVSSYMEKLAPGDLVDIQGPNGAYFYVPNGMREIGMIAGGSGITPMLPIIKAALKNPDDKTKITLVYANNSLDDILLKNKLDRLNRQYSDQFRIYYVLIVPPDDWAQGVGYVTKDIVAKWMPPPSDDIQLLVCGPQPMITDIEQITNELGYNIPKPISKLADQVFKF